MCPLKATLTGLAGSPLGGNSMGSCVLRSLILCNMLSIEFMAEIGVLQGQTKVQLQSYKQVNCMQRDDGTSTSY